MPKRSCRNCRSKNRAPTPKRCLECSRYPRKDNWLVKKRPPVSELCSDCVFSNEFIYCGIGLIQQGNKKKCRWKERIN